MSGHGKKDDIYLRHGACCLRIIKPAKIGSDLVACHHGDQLSFDGSLSLTLFPFFAPILMRLSLQLI